jgi:hypothetical protein
MRQARPSVRHTAEFDRIVALPRRIPQLSDAQTWADVLTRELLCSGARGSIRPWQAFCAAEVAEVGGGFLCLPVGFGKTFLAELIAAISGCSRAVEIVPANLRSKTYSDRQSYIGVWRLANPPPRIITTRDLTPESGEQLLKDLAPDLIIIDEADELANPDSSASRKIDRYVSKCRREGTPLTVVAMSGTPGRKSIMNYWHILCWCLDGGSPVPLHEGEAKMWAAAIDDHGTRVVRRPEPGPLGATLKEARAWYFERFSQTPGVVVIDGDSCDQPLHIEIRLAREDAKIDAHYERFLLENENPAGLPVTTPLSRWQIDSRMGLGYFEKYKKQPPEEVGIARRALAKFIREKIRESESTRKPLDTEGQVIKRYPEAQQVLDWQAVEHLFDPTTEVVWLSDSGIQDCVSWLAESPEPGVIWVGGIEFAERLSRVTRLPYYGAGGESQFGAELHRADPTKSMIVSWNANKKGFNLQGWSRFLITQPPQSAKWLEQLIGRHHRSGQLKPVRGTILATSGGTLDGFDAAVSEARFLKQTTGLTQKILRASITRAKPIRTKRNRFRWATGDDRSTREE